MRKNRKFYGAFIKGLFIDFTPKPKNKLYKCILHFKFNIEKACAQPFSLIARYASKDQLPNVIVISKRYKFVNDEKVILGKIWPALILTEDKVYLMKHYIKLPQILVYFSSIFLYFFRYNRRVVNWMFHLPFALFTFFYFFLRQLFDYFHIWFLRYAYFLLNNPYILVIVFFFSVKYYFFFFDTVVWFALFGVFWFIFAFFFFRLLYASYKVQRCVDDGRLTRWNYRMINILYLFIYFGPKYIRNHWIVSNVWVYFFYWKKTYMLARLLFFLYNYGNVHMIVPMMIGALEPFRSRGLNYSWPTFFYRLELSLEYLRYLLFLDPLRNLLYVFYNQRFFVDIFNQTWFFANIDLPLKLRWIISALVWLLKWFAFYLFFGVLFILIKFFSIWRFFFQFFRYDFLAICRFYFTDTFPVFFDYIKYFFIYVYLTVKRYMFNALNISSSSLFFAKTSLGFFLIKFFGSSIYILKGVMFLFDWMTFWHYIYIFIYTKWCHLFDKHAIFFKFDAPMHFLLLTRWFIAFFFLIIKRLGNHVFYFHDFFVYYIKNFVVLHNSLLLLAQAYLYCWNNLKLLNYLRGNIYIYSYIYSIRDILWLMNWMILTQKGMPLWWRGHNFLSSLQYNRSYLLFKGFYDFFAQLNYGLRNFYLVKFNSNRMYYSNPSFCLIFCGLGFDWSFLAF